MPTALHKSILGGYFDSVLRVHHIVRKPSAVMDNDNASGIYQSLPCQVVFLRIE